MEWLVITPEPLPHHVNSQGEDRLRNIFIAKNCLKDIIAKNCEVQPCVTNSKKELDSVLSTSVSYM